MTNDHDRTSAQQMGAHTTTSRTVADVHNSVTALFSDAEDLIAAGSQIDEAWLDSASGMLARACVEADLIVLTSFQNRLRALAGQMARTTATGDAKLVKKTGPDHLASAHGFERARAQVEVLAATTDAGAELVSARTMGGRAAFESSSAEASALRVLAEVDEMANRDLVVAVGKHATAISRATGRLREAGLIVGRYYGRNVDWSLTAAGREAVTGMRRHDEDAEEPVTTTDGAGLAQAVRSRKRAVRIPLQVVASDEPRWATFLRLDRAVTASDDAFETRELPDALVSNDPAAAYVRVDALREAVTSV